MPRISRSFSFFDDPRRSRWCAPAALSNDKIVGNAGGTCREFAGMPSLVMRANGNPRLDAAALWNVATAAFTAAKIENLLNPRP